jgi:hypothetical protein
LPILTLPTNRRAPTRRGGRARWRPQRIDFRLRLGAVNVSVDGLNFPQCA